MKNDIDSLQIIYDLRYLNSLSTRDEKEVFLNSLPFERVALLILTVSALRYKFNQIMKFSK
jgi:hypothetical protein